MADLTENDVFLDLNQVLEYVDINLRTFYRRIESGKLPASCKKVPSKALWSKKEIDDFLIKKP